jgi:NADH-quinone oxidoreductase subunit N
MNLADAIADLQMGLANDALMFVPELILCAAIVCMLLIKLSRDAARVHLGWFALILTVLAVAASVCQWKGAGTFRQPEAFDSRLLSQSFFGGMLVYDTFTIYLRIFLCGFTALVIWLSLLTGIPDREDSGDFYCLLLGATIGMSLMASANHLLMVYIGVEMASLPSYALAGYLKGRRKSSEAALKYVVYGGGASGIMLYGISLLAGKFGTGYLPDLAVAFAALSHAGAGVDPILLLGGLLVLVGLCFKLAAVPFHFWCPDVFEGASAEVAAFLSVASKGAALALTGRFAFALTGLVTRTADFDTWLSVARILGPGLAVLAALTATFGNLAAYAQTNLKRLLAYSTIAHAGYMMMALAPLSPDGAAAVLFYLIAYLFMNLGAFAIVAFIRNLTGSEDLSGYRGLVYRSPVLSVTLTLFLLSLLGIPPLAGFAAKFQIFSVLLNDGNQYVHDGHAGLGNVMYALLVIAGINTVFSAVYYLNVLKVMIIDKPVEELEGQAVRELPVSALSSFYAVVLAVMIVVVGVAWNPLARISSRGVNHFQPVPTPVAAAQQVIPS